MAVSNIKTYIKGFSKYLAVFFLFFCFSGTYTHHPAGVQNRIQHFNGNSPSGGLPDADFQVCFI